MNKFFVFRLRRIADGLSRCSPFGIVSLPFSRDHLSAWAGTLAVDLWATSFNRQLPLFIYPFRHPEARLVGTISLCWNCWELLYLFLPTALEEKSLLLASSARKGSLVNRLSPISPLWSILQESASESTIIRASGSVREWCLGARRVG